MNISTDQMTGYVLSQHCPSRAILEHLTSKWAVLIFYALDQKTLRFNELRKQIDGISEKMLAQTLKTLQSDGFIKRIDYAEVPPKVEYQLTEMGLEAASYLKQFIGWIEQNMQSILSGQISLR